MKLAELDKLVFLSHDLRRGR